ncbi:MAG: YeeE/YedE family protein [Rhodobacteraceae bacterium]|nr:MAG: YeeE/YedE family protein [Paracoccaceae bacterium]
MFESLGLTDTTPREASVLFALALGLAFGILAERTGFCLRRSVVGEDSMQARGVWLTALAVSLLATQAAVALGWIAFDAHRFLAPGLPVLAIALGGLAFGAGMVLTRGCASRLLVLGGSGNLRALLVLVVFAIVAHATMKGVLAPLRTGLGGITVDLGQWASLSALPGGAWGVTLVIAASALWVALRSGNRVTALAGGALIGLLAAIGWVGTGFVLQDEFDPIAHESLSFTAPAADSLFFALAATSIPAGFGTGLVGGVLLGALVASLFAGSFRWQSFESPAQTGRYMAGAALMGVGGVLAGGCTLGAGLSGTATLGVSAFLALAFIVLGALGAQALSVRSSAAAGAPRARPPLQPAE